MKEKTSGFSAFALLFVAFTSFGAVGGNISAQDASALSSWQRVSGIFSTSCGACHDWANTPSGILSMVDPGKPDTSAAYAAMERGSMPPDAMLPQADRDAVHDWIASGAIVPPELMPSAPMTASPSALPQAAKARPSIKTHMISGFLAGGFLLAAGAVGTWHLVDLMEAGHAYRDSIGFPEDGASAAQLALRSDYIAKLWADPKDQALRWTHVGLLAIGSAFYAYNAVTGIEMLTPEDPGLSKRDIHRYAFFAHAAMMASEAVLGFFTTDALKRGDHDAVIALATAHAAIGVAAPLTMIGSGLVFTFHLK